jgi:hypothetical protein
LIKEIGQITPINCEESKSILAFPKDKVRTDNRKSCEEHMVRRHVRR